MEKVSLLVTSDNEGSGWELKNSAFKEYIPDDEALLDKCFEVDFKNTKIDRFVKDKNELRMVGQIIHKNYKLLKDCYKYHAAIEVNEEIWSMYLNAFSNFARNAGMIDGQSLRLADLDLIFITTYTRPTADKHPRMPDRALVRHQFMEAICRIADKKYGTLTSPSRAVNKLIEEHLKNYCKQFDHDKWRVDRYWNQQVDAVIKSYLPILRSAFDKYSGQKTSESQKKFMSLEQFQKMTADMQLVNEHCTEKDVTLGFALAIMTQVDELESDRIFQMEFVEFLEAFARLADKYSAAPVGKTEAEISYEERREQLLYMKLEALIRRLFDLCPEKTKNIWVLPQVSIFEMEATKGNIKFTTEKKNIVHVDPIGPEGVNAYK